MKIITISMSRSSANELLDFLIVLDSVMDFERQDIVTIAHSSCVDKARHGVKIEAARWKNDMIRIWLPYQRLNIRFHDYRSGECYVLYRIRP